MWLNKTVQQIGSTFRKHVQIITEFIADLYWVKWSDWSSQLISIYLIQHSMYYKQTLAFVLGIELK